VAHVRSLAEGDLPIARIILLMLKVRVIFLGMLLMGFEPGSPECEAKTLPIELLAMVNSSVA